MDEAPLDSLLFFQPQFYSLTKLHPIRTSAGNNPYEGCSSAASGVAGCPGWSGDSSDFCSLPTCRLNPTPGTLSHILTECEDLSPARQKVFLLWTDHLKDKPLLLPIVRKYTVGSTTTQYTQFILDCTVLPDVIILQRIHGRVIHDSLLYLTRTLCISGDKTRNKFLGKWNMKW